MRISDWSSDVCSSDLFFFEGLREVVGQIAEEVDRDAALVHPVAGVFGCLVAAVRRQVVFIDHAVRRGEDQRQGILDRRVRSEEHTSELQSLMRISYAVFCL